MSWIKALAKNGNQASRTAVEAATIIVVQDSGSTSTGQEYSQLFSYHLLPWPPSRSLFTGNMVTKLHRGVPAAASRNHVALGHLSFIHDNALLVRCLLALLRQFLASRR
jgi:hypothetical protein